jgi:hypothetical protein
MRQVRRVFGSAAVLLWLAVTGVGAGGCSESVAPPEVFGTVELRVEPGIDFPAEGTFELRVTRNSLAGEPLHNEWGELTEGTAWLAFHLPVGRAVFHIVVNDNGNFWGQGTAEAVIEPAGPNLVQLYYLRSEWVPEGDVWVDVAIRPLVFPDLSVRYEYVGRDLAPPPNPDRDSIHYTFDLEDSYYMAGSFEGYRSPSPTAPPRLYVLPAAGDHSFSGTVRYDYHSAETYQTYFYIRHKESYHGWLVHATVAYRFPEAPPDVSHVVHPMLYLSKAFEQVLGPDPEAPPTEVERNRVLVLVDSRTGEILIMGDANGDGRYGLFDHFSDDPWLSYESTASFAGCIEPATLPGSSPSLVCYIDREPFGDFTNLWDEATVWSLYTGDFLGAYPAPALPAP